MCEIEFIKDYNNRNRKEKSLNDETFYTLEEIVKFTFNSYDDIEIMADGLLFELTEETFMIDNHVYSTYTNALNETEYALKLHNWLQTLEKRHFPKIVIKEFDDLEYLYIYDIILFDEWWDDFVSFRKKIACHCEELLNK